MKFGCSIVTASLLTPISVLMSPPIENVGIDSSPSFLCGGETVRLGKLLGSGGGGDVFEAQYSGGLGVFKISKRSSAASVRNECEILQYLEGRSIKNIEKYGFRRLIKAFQDF